jgi:ABC-type multidrug transport system ATPase subunit
MISFKNLTFHYKKTKNGINNISFDANYGDFIALVGKNGAGKTSFFNIITGISKPTKGSIEVNGHLEYNKIGICTQKQSIDWYLNVYDNIFLGAIFANTKKKYAHKYTENILDLLDLKNLSKRSPDSLSRGQQQRVQVGRALVHNPEFIILDEPTSGLDIKYSTKLFEYLYNKCKKENRLIIVSSHELDMLENYCDKILYIENGHQLFYGNMKDFLNEYTESNKMVINFRGNIKEKEKNELLDLKAYIDENKIYLSEEYNDNLNKIITIILNKADIISINKNKITIKDILKK